MRDDLTTTTSPEDKTMGRALHRHTNDFIDTRPAPGDDTVARLRHVVDVFMADSTPDDSKMVMATMGVYPDQPWTGLTLGDLKALLALIDAR